MYNYPRGLSVLQKISVSLMGVLVLLTFFGANLHAVLWQSSEWLVSTVLPAVVVNLTNEERADNAAPPLRRSAVLDEAARLKAEDMATHEYFAHYSPDGVSPWHWFNEVGYVYAHAGENLAIHFTDSAEVVEAWMDSPAHRANIVDGKFVEIGVGTAKGRYEGYDTVYVVQLFGTPAVPPSPRPAPQAPAIIESVVQEPLVVETTPIEITSEPTASSSVVREVLAASEPEEVESVSVVPVVTGSAVVAVAEEPAPASQAPADELPENQATQTPTSGLAITPESVSAPTSAPELADVVVIESPVISTSSGLAVAQITTPQGAHAGQTIGSIATQPNKLLQITYLTLGTLVIFLLTASVVIEARRFRFMQVAYGVFLIVGMGGLWFVHAWLTGGAVVA